MHYNALLLWSLASHFPSVYCPIFRATCRFAVLMAVCTVLSLFSCSYSLFSVHFYMNRIQIALNFETLNDSIYFALHYYTIFRCHCERTSERTLVLPAIWLLENVCCFFFFLSLHSHGNRIYIVLTIFTISRPDIVSLSWCVESTIEFLICRMRSRARALIKVCDYVVGAFATAHFIP